MDFEGQYLKYEEYKNLGETALEIMPFNLLEFEVRRKIDIRTQNRLKDLEDIPDEVKLCEYKLINTITGYLKSSLNESNANIASESIDGYSVNYITPDRISEIVKSHNIEINDIIRTYLLDVKINNEHILYVGVDK